MGRPETYTLSWIANASGFDARTIAYYVQEGLLPKVGRRGRGTRYSQEFLDRLLFIRRVRDLQDAGRLRAVTLSEIRGVLDDLLEEEIRRGAADDVEAEWLRGLFEDPDLDTSDMAVPAESVARMMMAEPGIPRARSALGLSQRRERLAAHVDEMSPTVLSRASQRSMAASEDPRVDDLRMGDLLREIDRRSTSQAKAAEGTASEHVTRVPITEALYIAAKNISEDDAKLVEELAALLRRKAEA